MNEDEATNFASVVDELWAAKSRLRKIEAILDDDTEMREVIACSCDQSLALGDIIDKIQNVIDS